MLDVCVYIYIYMYTCIHMYIYIYMRSPPWINKPLLLTKSRGPRKLINAQQQIPGKINKRKKKIQLGVILGVILGVPKSALGLRGSKSVTFD